MIDLSFTSSRLAGMNALKPTILVIADDPQHLRLAAMVLERGGFHSETALVRSTAVAFPEMQRPDAVALDYRLNSTLSAVDVANMVHSRYPGVPIVVLSALPWMPDDIKSHAKSFVSKGEPEELIETLRKLTGTEIN